MEVCGFTAIIHSCIYVRVLRLVTGHIYKLVFNSSYRIMYAGTYLHVGWQ